MNEDSILLLPDRGLFAVADGMGGHRGGRVASNMVTSELAEIARVSGRPLSGDELERALLQINRHVFERGESDFDLQRMGSTCVAVSIHGTRGVVAHIGDSRCYLVRDGRSEQLTSDHRAIQSMIDQGALTELESRVHPMRNVLTRSVGVEPEVDVSRREIELREGDRLVLCSDGLTDMLTEHDIASEVASVAELESLVEVLVERANAAGGNDNISVIVIHIGESGALSG